MEPTSALNLDLERSRQRWLHHPFFAPDAVVLGLDIGIEGIGICIRIGTKVIYCKTLLVELPESQALAKRRQLRAARHARKNYRTRMSRLRRLFEKHGLPWVSDDVYSRSDPFMLRYRALHGANPLASKEALSLCIRSCVALRGYDYFAMSRMGDEYPWGASLALADAQKWLSSAFVDEKMKDFLIGMADTLTNKKGDELSEVEREQWAAQVNDAYSRNQEYGIDARLKKYAKAKRYDRKARGANFPRQHVEAHLRLILERHRHLLGDYEEFVSSLFLDNETKRHKKLSIFHYNRKTPAEAQRHFDKKVKPCPYCAALKLPSQPCGLSGDIPINCWKLVDFLSNRRLDLKNGKLTYRATLPASGIAAMVDAVQHKVTSWQQVKKGLMAAIAPVKLVEGGDWNKAQITQLKDICVPQSRNQRASMSVAAAEKLYEIVTVGGTCFEPAAMETAKKELGLYTIRAEVAAAGGIFPQVRTLLGTVKRKGGEQRFVTTGFLQSLFKQLEPQLPAGKAVPDYVVIECVKGAPLNTKQKAELESKQKQNRDKKQKLAEKCGLEKMTRSAAYRLRLFEEQGGFINKTSAICPFTGQQLGTDPMSAELELAHLFPDSRGGLYVSENLVLTTRKVNQDMGNRTPREAAAAALPDWLNWEDMCKGARAFNWSESKQHLFHFEPTEEEPFPNFNNLTRTAQLAAELRNLAALWLGINADPEAVRQRIGNPSGTYTAAARCSMLAPDYRKDRATTTHHRMDALVMSCIPPGEGINDVRYGGIFYTEKLPDARGKEQRRLVSLTDLPLPDFAAVDRDGSECPVIKKRSHGKYSSLGDSTFWSVDGEGKTRQRTKLAIGKDTTADKLLQTMRSMQIPDDYLPKKSTIERWIEKQTPATKDDVPSGEPLRLRGGAPLKSIHKFSSKGDLINSPMGWNGLITKDGRFDQLRKLDASNERLELWIGWNSKKKQWEYQKRVIPTFQVMLGVKRMGLPWRGRTNAPDYLVRLLDENKKPDLKTLVCGSLYPHSVHVADVRKGERFLLTFPALKKKEEQGRLNDDALPIETWGEVTAVKSAGEIEIKSITHKDRGPRTTKSADCIAMWLGFPNASSYAQQEGLLPPI